uniref:Uncharacterized protein n=1 Tax=Arundo donax TaxID=35708 RepID=A0A0A8Y5Q9_ARUDO
MNIFPLTNNRSVLNFLMNNQVVNIRWVSGMRKLQ